MCAPCTAGGHAGPPLRSGGSVSRSILIVDDEANLRKVLAAMLEREGYTVHAAEDGEQGLSILGCEPVDVVVTDLKMPAMDGMALLERIRERWPEIPVLLTTAYGTVDTAVAALKAGAFDYITKPFEQEEILAIVAKAVRQRELDSAELHPRDGEKGRYDIIGRCPAMLKIYDLIEQVADTPSTVLITGESGTGKELITTALHENSSRREQPLIRINCAAIPKDLVESELFGYERGAFTGAVGSKPGRFELADGGTLFLDEIAEIPAAIQVKLLRALQNGEFERVGGTRTSKVDVRLVAATNRNLEDEIAAGRFREDLFYRLNVVTIALPPLRERPDDIPLLLEHFVESCARRHGRSRPRVDDEFLELLKSFDWPGNIRQLENVVETILLQHSAARLTVGLLPPEITGAERPAPRRAMTPAGGSLKEVVKAETRRLEKDLIARALEETGGNVTQAAKKLGLSRKGLQLKMKELGLR